MEKKAKHPAQFQKGQSGNPAGRPKGSKNKATVISEAIQGKLVGQLEKDAQAILLKTIEMAKDGDTTCIKLLMDRLMPAMRAGDNAKASGVGGISITVNTLDKGPTTIEGEVIDHDE